MLIVAFHCSFPGVLYATWGEMRLWQQECKGSRQSLLLWPLKQPYWDVGETLPASACTSGCIAQQARAQGPIYGHLHFKDLGNTRRPLFKKSARLLEESKWEGKDSHCPWTLENPPGTVSAPSHSGRFSIGSTSPHHEVV